MAFGPYFQRIRPNAPGCAPGKKSQLGIFEKNPIQLHFIGGKKLAMMKKILLVDDDILLHRLMRHQLERDGFASLHAIDGHEALNLALTHLPDLMVVDIIMDKLDGISTLRELRKNLLTRAIPVIVITTSTLGIARHEAKTLGAQDFIIKPVSPAQLVARIRAVLGQNPPPHGAGDLFAAKPTP